MPWTPFEAITVSCTPQRSLPPKRARRIEVSFTALLQRERWGVSCTDFCDQRSPLNSRVRCASSPFSVSILKNVPGPGSESPWSPFGRRLRRLCGSPWPDSHFGKVLHRTVTCFRLWLISQGIPVDYGVPKNGGGSLSTVFASLWLPVRFLRRK
jgi:hypothetical protein